MRALLLSEPSSRFGEVISELDERGLATDCLASLDEAEIALDFRRYLFVAIATRSLDEDAVRLLSTVRRKQPLSRILVLGDQLASATRVAALDAGADDVLAAEADPREVRARIRALLRRPDLDETRRTVQIGDLGFRVDTREIVLRGKPISLRRREASLLAALLTRRRRIVSRQSLVAEVYGFADEPSSNTLDAHICRLRRRLRAEQARATIRTVRGIGYQLDEVA